LYITYFDLQLNQLLLAEVVSDLASALIRDPVNY